MKTRADGTVPVLSKVAYGSGDMSFTFGTAITGFYLLIFLTNVVGLKGYMASLIIFIGFLWDAITDPIVGYYSDQINSRIGRRRTLILWAIVPLGLSFFAIFGISTLIAKLSPEMMGLMNAQINIVLWLKTALVLVVYLLFYLCYTLAYIPYISLINDMTKKYHERTKLTGYRMVFTIVATIVAVAVPDLIMGDVTLTHSGDQFVLISAIFGVLMVLILVFSVAFTYELPTKEKVEKAKFRFYKDFVACFKEPDFRRTAFAFMFSLAAIFVLQDTIQYYVNYWLLSPELFLPLAGSVLVLGFLSVIFWVYVSNRIGKKYTLYIGSLCWVVAFLMLMGLPQLEFAEVALEFENETYILPLGMADAIKSFPWWGWIAVFILGLGMGNIHLSAYGMYPDSISLIAKDNPDKEGSFFGSVSFLQKVGIGLATLVIGPILDLFGYTAKPDASWFENLAEASLSIDNTWLYLQADSAAPMAIKLTFCLLPIVLMLFAAWSVREYKGDEILKQEKR
ncbi:MAG: MFS transporter [Bacilli bacterium]|nr:MFS transporter [Bacilli bacterium]MBN2696294.1 MFS transporter [Bacilli bacterium]